MIYAVLRHMAVSGMNIVKKYLSKLSPGACEYQEVCEERIR
jgi:hypothetical protein